MKAQKIFNSVQSLTRKFSMIDSSLFFVRKSEVSAAFCSSCWTSEITSTLACSSWAGFDPPPTSSSSAPANDASSQPAK
jgi:hypothetical protein